MNLVFDSNALIAYLKTEPGALVVKDLLEDQANECFIHSVNLCEVYYQTRREYGESVAQQTMQVVHATGLNVQVDMDEDFWQEAGRIKADYKRVSLADCFCVALSNRVSGEVVTSDHHEIEPLVEAGVCKVRFFR
ncbi:MAG: type II toxin-antitoxin system VapC family toxin [Deltaproteobacteria bacterium]